MRKGLSRQKRLEQAAPILADVLALEVIWQCSGQEAANATLERSYNLPHHPQNVVVICGSITNPDWFTHEAQAARWRRRV